ncbi:uncharacterized protein LOC128395072 [Panonychus citri]|uniref:uncharacterized protein LOC128395072 n=1 Tax=Panonychus citri TaxID=50023 RepID=UPI00230824F7|nr:uncharacterized protein LOC128395072 [Panonychus citri]
MDLHGNSFLNCDSLINQRLNQIKEFKENSSWLEDEVKCDLICETVSFLDGSSLNHLFILTPFILRLIDDHQHENKLKGLNCLNNIITRYGLCDLESANFHQLFWSNLKKLLYNNDGDVVKSLIPLLVYFIEKFSLGQGEIDQCFDQLIKNQLISSDKTLFLININGILQFIKKWPKELVKFSKKILEMTLTLIEDQIISSTTYQLIVSSIEVLELIISRNGKLSYLYAGQILITFIKFKFNLIDKKNNLDGNQTNNLNMKIESCLLELKTNNPKLLAYYCDLLKKRSTCDDSLLRLTFGNLF